MKNVIFIILAFVVFACKKEEVKPSQNHVSRDPITYNGQDYRYLKSDFTGLSTWGIDRFYSAGSEIFQPAAKYTAVTSERIQVVGSLCYEFPHEIQIVLFKNDTPINTIHIKAKSGLQNISSVLGVIDLLPGETLDIQINFAKSKENLILYKENNGNKTFIHFGKP